MDLHRILHFTKCFGWLICILITNLYCIISYLIWMWIVLLPFRLINHPGYWYIEGFMYKWLLSVVASWSWKSNFHILELGDDVNFCIKDKCLFLVNHQSTADVPLLMQAFQEKGPVLQSIMWIMDRMFRYTNFGAVSVTHGDYFITQGKNVRDSEMKKLRNHLLNQYLGRNRRWIVLFPEGGFLSKRKETSMKYAIKNNFPVLEHVTLPRIGAMHVIMNTLNRENLGVLERNSLLTGTTVECEPLKWIIDITVAYPDPSWPLSIFDILCTLRQGCVVYMHYRRYSVHDVPRDNIDSLRDWVYARWCEKEELLEEYYRTKKFPFLPKSKQSENRNTNELEQKCHEVQMSQWQIAFLHIFFMSCGIFHCYWICKIWCLTQYQLWH